MSVAPPFRLARLSLVTKLVLVFAVLIALTAAAVGGGAIWEIRSEVANQVIDRQNNSLRTLAVLLRKTFPTPHSRSTPRAASAA